MKKLTLALIAMFAFSAVSFADEHAATTEHHDETTTEAAPAEHGTMGATTDHAKKNKKTKHETTTKGHGKTKHKSETETTHE